MRPIHLKSILMPMPQAVTVKGKNYLSTPTHPHRTRMHPMSYEPMPMRLMRPLLARMKPVTRATHRTKTQNMSPTIHLQTVLIVRKLQVPKVRALHPHPTVNVLLSRHLPDPLPLHHPPVTRSLLDSSPLPPTVKWTKCCQLRAKPTVLRIDLRTH